MCVSIRPGWSYFWLGTQCQGVGKQLVSQRTMAITNSPAAHRYRSLPMDELTDHNICNIYMDNGSPLRDWSLFMAVGGPGSKVGGGHRKYFEC